MVKRIDFEMFWIVWRNRRFLTSWKKWLWPNWSGFIQRKIRNGLSDEHAKRDVERIWSQNEAREGKATNTKISHDLSFKHPNLVIYIRNEKSLQFVCIIWQHQSYCFWERGTQHWNTSNLILIHRPVQHIKS